MPVDVWALDGLTLDGPETRRADSAMVMTNGAAGGSRSGVRPGDPGLTVTLAGSTINVSAGVAMIGYSGQGVYRVAFPSSVSPGTLTAAHATLSRIDLVYLRVWDTAVDGAGLAKGDVVYLAGTASATPSVPTPAGTLVYMPLATISVPAVGGGSPSVSTAARPVTVAPGGIVPDAATPGYYAGQYRDNGAGLERYNGTTWTAAGPGTGAADWEADIKLGASRKLVIGTDCTLYRSAANVLKTGNDLIIKTHRALYGETGSRNISFTSQNAFTLAVTFTTPFAAVPRVSTNINSGIGATARWCSRAINITATGFDLFLFAADGTASTWSTIQVLFEAVAP
ncbi:H-type lectin domain-containing protein [Streptomyces sp. NPDC059970]|uniref:H-type lectin domain-containing protein n=1 Tax=Streptomyces sp. NPDC059970 TaxID=3347019 RepID=UPI0036978147